MKIRPRLESKAVKFRNLEEMPLNKLQKKEKKSWNSIFFSTPLVEFIEYDFFLWVAEIIQAACYRIIVTR